MPARMRIPPSPASLALCASRRRRRRARGRHHRLLGQSRAPSATSATRAARTDGDARGPATLRPAAAPPTRSPSRGGAGVAGGLDAALDDARRSRAGASLATVSPSTQLLAGEVTHTQPTNFARAALSFQFSVVAPASGAHDDALRRRQLDQPQRHRLGRQARRRRRWHHRHGAAPPPAPPDFAGARPAPICRA